MKNYYEILEVSKNASQEIIEKAYKTLAKKYHPDTQTDDNKLWAESKFKEINEAYKVLSNIEKRKNYDVELLNIQQSNNDLLHKQNNNFNINIINIIHNYIKKPNSEKLKDLIALSISIIFLIFMCKILKIL